MILLALRQNNLSLRELSLESGYAKPTDTVRAVVNILMQDGEIEFMYPS